jgi:hypothetical protein
MRYVEMRRQGFYTSTEEKLKVLKAFSDLKDQAGATFSDDADDSLWKIFEIIAQTPVVE